LPSRDLAPGLIQLGFSFFGQLEFVLEVIVNLFADRLNLRAGQFWNGGSNLLSYAHGAHYTLASAICQRGGREIVKEVEALRGGKTEKLKS
jgi:hypothetical protein